MAVDHVSLPVTMPFYGAFVLDLVGFKIEAVCRRGE